MSCADSNGMERKMDLLRDILLFVEAYYPENHGGKELLGLRLCDFPGHSITKETLDDHVSMLINAKVLTMLQTRHRGQILAITLEGYDFLDEIRDPKWFEKIKKAVGTDSWTINAMREAHKRLRKQADMVIGICVATTVNWAIGIIAWFFGYIRFG